jgi:hypothetical protein
MSPWLRDLYKIQDPLKFRTACGTFCSENMRIFHNEILTQSIQLAVPRCTTNTECQTSLSSRAFAYMLVLK